MVIVYHSTFFLTENPALWRGSLFRRAVVFVLTRMWMGVPIFFVISGYCISATCDSGRRKPSPMAQYLKRRLRRIYPPYLIFIGLTAAAFAAATRCGADRLFTDAAHTIHATLSLTWVQWLGNLTLTESWLPLLAGSQRYFMMHAWSLCYEEQFYAVCGLMLLFSPRRFFSSALGISAAVFAAALLSAHGFLPSFSGAFFDGRWLLFAMGMAVYYSVNYADRAVRLALLGGLAAIALAFFAWGLAVHDIGNDVRQYGAGAAAAVAMLLLNRHDSALMSSRLLNPVRLCGVICYSLYLVHWPVCEVLSNALDIAGVSGFTANAPDRRPALRGLLDPRGLDVPSLRGAPIPQRVLSIGRGDSDGESGRPGRAKHGVIRSSEAPRPRFATLRGPMPLIPRRLEGKLIMLPTFAAAMAFYFVVSLVPFLIVVTRAVAWMFSANLTPQLTTFLRDVLPPESSLRPEALAAAVQGGGKGFWAVSTLVAAYTASSGLNELARAVHYIFSDERRPHPGGWLRRLKSLGLLGIWTLAIGATAVFLVLIPLVSEAIARFSPATQFPVLLSAVVRYLAAFALMFAAFALTYAFVPEPAHRPRWGAAVQGALVAAVSWMGTCFVFAYFLPRVWGVSLFHGVLSSALATLVWAYCGCWGVLIGACWAAAVGAREGLTGWRKPTEGLRVVIPASEDYVAQWILGAVWALWLSAAAPASSKRSLERSPPIRPVASHFVGMILSAASTFYVTPKGLRAFSVWSWSVYGEETLTLGAESLSLSSAPSSACAGLSPIRVAGVRKLRAASAPHPLDAIWPLAPPETRPARSAVAFESGGAEVRFAEGLVPAQAEDLVKLI